MYVYEDRYKGSDSVCLPANWVEMMHNFIGSSLKIFFGEVIDNGSRLIRFQCLQ